MGAISGKPGLALGGSPGPGAWTRSRGHSPVVATQGEGALRGGRRAALEVVDASLVDDDKAQGPCGQCGEAGVRWAPPLRGPHSPGLLPSPQAPAVGTDVDKQRSALATPGEGQTHGAVCSYQGPQGQGLKLAQGRAEPGPEAPEARAALQGSLHPWLARQG